MEDEIIITTEIAADEPAAEPVAVKPKRASQAGLFIGCRVPTEDLARFDALAKRSGLSRSQAMREAITEWCGA